MFEIIKGEIVTNPIIIPIVFTIGIITAISRPYTAFLFGIFISLSLGTESLYLAKLPGLSFITMIDVCLIVIIFAWRRDKKKSSEGNFGAKKIGLVLISVLLIGFFQSLVRYEYPYLTFRALRWAINIPLLIIISADLVNTKERVNSLLIVLLSADVTSSFQHLFWLTTQGANYSVEDSSNAFRNISFLRGQTGWIASGFFTTGKNIFKPWLQLSIGVLFIVVLITQQTRSVAIGLIASIIIFNFLFVKKIELDIFVKILITLILMLGVASIVLKMTGYENLLVAYIDRITQTSLDSGGNSDTLTRINAFNVETNDWISGNPIFGEGLFYYQRYGFGLEGSNISTTGYVAFGHLGYIIYLSQLGLLGFIAYGFWFPISIVIKSKQIFDCYQNIPSIKYLSCLTATTFIQCMIGFAFSGSFIGGYLLIPGILGGSIYGVNKSDIFEGKSSRSTRQKIHVN